MNVRDPELKLNSSGDIKKTDQASEMLPYPHESATAHVTGSALYVDDVALPGNALHVEVGVSEHASARLKSVDLTKVRTSEVWWTLLPQPIYPVKTRLERFCRATGYFPVNR